MSNNFLNCLPIFTVSQFQFKEKVKTYRISWIIHSGVGIELFTMILVSVFWSSKYDIKFITAAIPAIVLLAVKVYSWIAMVSLFKLETFEARKEAFGSQWITNIIRASPNIRLTLPHPDVVQLS